jgi:glyoxylase-like metal-dependent hydrolase (beta-lactamase superfamily II)
LTLPRACNRPVALEEFRKINQLPISYIIYTHHHGDHINGARVFKSDSTKIIAQKELPNELARIRAMAAYNQRLNAAQFGMSLPESERGAKLAERLESGFAQPDIFFDDKHAFEEGGVRFELYHTLGETFDHLNRHVDDAKFCRACRPNLETVALTLADGRFPPMPESPKRSIRKRRRLIHRGFVDSQNGSIDSSHRALSM